VATRSESSLETVHDTALRLLARREHTRLELHHKLCRRGFDRALVDAVLGRLAEQDLLSDARFAEVYAHGRVDKGYGPLRIERELRERGVADTIVADLVAALADDWLPRLVALHRKRFGAVPRDPAGQAAQMRFLRQRGFTSEQIRCLFRGA
jgi:regulatory protein